MTNRRTYWQRLKDHPGVPVATFITFAGLTFASLFAGLDRGGKFGVFAACFVGGWCWGLVLWSNRSRE